MLPVEPEHQAGDSQPIQPTVGAFLRSSTLEQAIRGYQATEARRNHAIPLDVALADMMIHKGRVYIHSVMAACHEGEDDRAFMASHTDGLRESIAAITFGIAYLGLRTFLTTSSPDAEGDHIFDNTAFRERVGNAMFDTPLLQAIAFSPNQPQDVEEIITAAKWSKMIGVVRDVGFAGLLNGYGWAELPAVVTQFVSKLDRENTVPQMVEMFQGALMTIETGDERTARINSVLREPLPPVTPPTDSAVQTRRDTPTDPGRLSDSDMRDLLGDHLTDLVNGL